MSRRLSLAFLSAMFVYGLSIAFAPSALAVNCDVNACISACSKKCGTPGCACASSCLQTMDQRKKSGQCKKQRRLIFSRPKQ
jgi:hypothetical protein